MFEAIAVAAIAVAAVVVTTADGWNPSLPPFSPTTHGQYLLRSTIAHAVPQEIGGDVVAMAILAVVVAAG